MPSNGDASLLHGKGNHRAPAEYGARLMGRYPLGRGACERSDIHRKKYRESNAQIVLRRHTQMELITIHGSEDSKYIRDNFDVFDSTLTEAEKIAALNGMRKYYYAGSEREEKCSEMHLPWEA